ncbi:hypothetical protein FQZ97_1148370 [compost metagenome]
MVLDEQDQPHVRVLEAVLVAGITTDSPLGPLVAGELDDLFRLVEQRHDFRTDQAVVQLPHRIHATAQQTHTGKVGESTVHWVHEKQPFGRLMKITVLLEDQARLMNWFFHVSPR